PVLRHGPDLPDAPRVQDDAEQAGGVPPHVARPLVRGELVRLAAEVEDLDAAGHFAGSDFAASTTGAFGGAGGATGSTIFGAATGGGVGVAGSSAGAGTGGQPFFTSTP